MSTTDGEGPAQSIYSSLTIEPFERARQIILQYQFHIYPGTPIHLHAVAQYLEIQIGKNLRQSIALIVGLLWQLMMSFASSVVPRFVVGNQAISPEV